MLEDVHEMHTAGTIVGGEGGVRDTCMYLWKRCSARFEGRTD